MFVPGTEYDIGRTRDDNAEYVIEQLRSIEITPAPNSRLMQMKSALTLGKTLPFNLEDPVFAAALEAERDMQQIAFVFDHIKTGRNNPNFLNLMKKAVGDSVLPQKDLRNSKGRDAQFELYLGAVCHRARLFPIDFTEPPDVIFVANGQSFGIAAKRIKNANNVEEHIKKGAAQILRSKLPGIIAIDMSLAFNRSNQPIISQLQSRLQPDIAKLKAHQFLTRRAKKIRRWVAGNGVLAAVVFNFWIRLHERVHWGMDGMTMWFETFMDERSKRDYDLFYTAFMRGVPNVRESEAKDEFT